MKKSALLTIIVLLFSTLSGYAHVQTRALNKTEAAISRNLQTFPEPPIQWNLTLLWYDAHATSVQQTSDGGYIVLAWGRTGPSQPAYIWLFKLNGGGFMEWNRTYTSPYYSPSPQQVRQTLEGGYIILATLSYYDWENMFWYFDVWLFKTDPYGNLEWNKTYGKGGSDTKGIDEAFSVVQTFDEGYVFAGTTFSWDTASLDFWLVKTDPFGKAIWEKTYGGMGTEIAYSLQQTFDRGYIVAGYTTSFGAGNEDFWLVKTDMEGNMEWNKTYGWGGKDQANSVQQTLDGGYIVAGQTKSFGEGHFDFWLIKTDAYGNMEWNKTYGWGGEDKYTGWDVANSVWQTFDGGYVVTGYTDFNGAGMWDFSWKILKTDAFGNVEWEKIINGVYGKATLYDVAYCIQQTLDGGYIVAGGHHSEGAWLVKLAPTSEITISNIVKSKYIVGSGYPLLINVTVTNAGEDTQTLNVTVHANTILIDSQALTINNESCATLTFMWNTNSAEKGIYRLAVYITQGGILLTGAITPSLLLTIPGDVDGDFDVDIYDIVKICVAYKSRRGDPSFNPNADIDGDGRISIYDVVIACVNYKKSW